MIDGIAMLALGVVAILTIGLVSRDVWRGWQRRRK